MTKKLGSSVLRSAGLRIVNVGLGFSVVVVLARTLGAGAYGLYSTALVMASIGTIVVQFGLPNLVMRETAMAAASKDLHRMRMVWVWALRGAAMFCLAVMTVGAALLLVLRNAMDWEQLSTYALALCLVPLLAFGALRSGALRGLHHVVIAQVPEVIVKPGVMLALVLMLGPMLPVTATSAMGMQLVSAGLALLLGTLFLWQRLPEKLSERSIKSAISTAPLWKAALIMSVATGFQQINSHADILMIGVFGTSEDVGLYRVSYQISMICAFGLQITAAVFSPSFAHLHKRKDTDALQILLTRAALLSTVTGLILAAPWLLYGEILTEWIFGSEFKGSWTTTMILIGAQIMSASFGPIGMLMNMTGLERYVARFMMLAAIVNLVLNSAFIPLFGPIGAAYATFVTFTIWNVCLWWAARRHLSLNSHIMALLAAKR